MWRQSAEAVPIDHPCLAGHFPGNPIVPGTLILERVIELVTQRNPESCVSEVINAKFIQPLLPGQVFELRVEEKPGLISFECVVNEKSIATGKLALIEPGHILE